MSKTAVYLFITFVRLRLTTKSAQKMKVQNVMVSVIIHLLLAGLFASSHYLCPFGIKALECGLIKNANIFYTYSE